MIMTFGDKLLAGLLLFFATWGLFSFADTVCMLLVGR